MGHDGNPLENFVFYGTGNKSIATTRSFAGKLTNQRANILPRLRRAPNMPTAYLHNIVYIRYLQHV